MSSRGVRLWDIGHSKANRQGNQNSWLTRAERKENWIGVHAAYIGSLRQARSKLVLPREEEKETQPVSDMHPSSFKRESGIPVIPAKTGIGSGSASRQALYRGLQIIVTLLRADLTSATNRLPSPHLYCSETWVTLFRVTGETEIVHSIVLGLPPSGGDHRKALNELTSQKCYPCPRTSVTYVSGPYTLGRGGPNLVAFPAEAESRHYIL
jgi:hypothetical protein